jgi:5'-3' exonuclease
MNIQFDQSQEFSIVDDTGKIRFYVEKMGITSEESLEVACKEYIKGWEWVYNYYFYENISWDWYYPNHFAPFFADLARVNMNKKSSDEVSHFSKGKPLRPMEQLLAVLPPKSKHLLPKCLQGTFEKFKEMYPMDFKIDMFQKCMDWQALSILPFIKIENIRLSYEEVQSSLTFKECERNLSSYPLLFSRQPSFVGKLYTLYTNLTPYENLDVDGTCFRFFPINKINQLDSSVVSNGFTFINKAVKASFDQRKPFKRATKSKV